MGIFEDRFSSLFFFLARKQFGDGELFKKSKQLFSSTITSPITQIFNRSDDPPFSTRYCNKSIFKKICKKICITRENNVHTTFCFI